MIANQEGEHSKTQLDESKPDPSILNLIVQANQNPANDSPDAGITEPDPTHPGIRDPGITDPVVRDPEEDIDPDGEIDPESDPEMPDRDMIDSDADVK